MQLEDKVILVTGASGGIGEVVSRELANAGARIIAVGQDKGKIDALVAALGGAHTGVAADLATPEGIEAVVHVVEARGGIDILVNNAGVAHFGLLEQQSFDGLRAQIDVNLLAPMLLTRYLLPVLKRSSDPAIVNMGSTFGSIGYGGFSAYCATKFGLRGFTEALRRELADTPVRTFYLAPRATRTPINDARVVAMNHELGNKMDDPAVVARHLLELLQGENGYSRYIGWPEKLFILINSVIPRIVDRALSRQLPVIRRFAQQ